MTFDPENPAPALVAFVFVLALFAARYVVALAIRAVRPLLGRLARLLTPETRIVRWVLRGEALAAARWPRATAFLRRQLSPRQFTGLPLTALIFSAAILALLFSEITEEVLEGGRTEALDRALLDALRPLHNPTLVAVFAWLTQAGDTMTLMVASGVAGALLLAQRQAPLAVGLAVAVAGSQTMMWVAKVVIDRDRPEFLVGVTAASPSFPSGHATGAVAVYGFIAYAASRLLPPGPQRFEIAFWAGAFVLMIGFSRIFLHVHYPTDVLGGFLAGTLWLILGIAVAEWAAWTQAASRPGRDGTR